MAILGRDDILGSNDIKVHRLDVPEWNGTVCVRVLSGSERDAFEASLQGDKSRTLQNFRARFAALVLCDEKGEKLFSASDVEQLGKKSGAALDRILEFGMQVNKVSEKDVEEIVGNSPTVPNANSGSV